MIGYSKYWEDKELVQQKGNEKAAKQPKWEREEVVLLVAEYFRTRDLPRMERLRSIAFISRILRTRAGVLGMVIDDTFRNEKGIEMKFGNIQYSESIRKVLRAEE